MPSISPRTHRANALNVASTMWCALSPLCFFRVIEKPSASVSASKNGSVKSVRYVPMHSRPVPGPYGARAKLRLPTPNTSRTHVEYASSRGAANSAAFRVLFSPPAQRHAATPGASVCLSASPSALPAARATSVSSSAVPLWSLHGSDRTPFRVTKTETPSCACDVSWSIMWSRKGSPVAIWPRVPRFTTNAVALVVPISAVPAPSGHTTVADDATSVEAFGTHMVDRGNARRPRRWLLDALGTKRDPIVHTAGATQAATHAMARMRRVLPGGAGVPKQARGPGSASRGVRGSGDVVG
mmetsp:Transcript_1450/g.5523  ORF Transcript_1450/g.5523 Transcript_1450/m.5523 type:complete len:298 (-) Transcript_1450:4-897(-)